MEFTLPDWEDKEYLVSILRDYRERLARDRDENILFADTALTDEKAERFQGVADGIDAEMEQLSAFFLKTFPGQDLVP